VGEGYKIGDGLIRTKNSLIANPAATPSAKQIFLAREANRLVLPFVSQEAAPHAGLTGNMNRPIFVMDIWEKIYYNCP